jgi:hypothetical protein
MGQRLFCFLGGDAGPWRVLDIRVVRGSALASVARVAIAACEPTAKETGAGVSWVLRGATSNDRYVTREEKARLAAVQPPLGRPEADCAALIPIRKSSEWWALPQDERRRIFEEQSTHIKMVRIRAVRREGVRQSRVHPARVA